jgi:hypothetical protein
MKLKTITLHQKEPASLKKCWFVFLMISAGPVTFLHLFINLHWFFYLLTFLMGWFTWTFAEYMMHRFAFHDRDTKKYQSSDHFRHHVQPKKIFLQQYKKLGLLILAVSLTCLVSLSPFFSFPAAFFTGFAFFNYLHRWLHQSWAVHVFPSLQKFHMQHHCGMVHECFGVTSTLWDEIFDTCAEEKFVGEKIRQFYFTKQENRKKERIQIPA